MDFVSRKYLYLYFNIPGNIKFPSAIKIDGFALTKSAPTSRERFKSERARARDSLGARAARVQRFLSACEKVALRESRVFHRSEPYHREVVSRARARAILYIRKISERTHGSRYAWAIPCLACLSCLLPSSPTYHRSYRLNEYTDNNPYSVSLGWVVLRKPWRPCIIAS